MTTTLQAPTMTKEARRVYITTVYGHPIIAKLKDLGAKWEPESKRWWLGSAKEEAVTKLVEEFANVEKPQEDPREIVLVGKAEYKGRTYYVRFIGDTKARLISLDGKVDFWAELGTGEGQARIVKRYAAPQGTGRYRREGTTLRSIQKFLEKKKAEEKEEKAIQTEMEERKAQWEKEGREKGEPEPTSTRLEFHCLECGAIHHFRHNVDADGMGCTRCN